MQEETVTSRSTKTDLGAAAANWCFVHVLFAGSGRSESAFRNPLKFVPLNDRSHGACCFTAKIPPRPRVFPASEKAASAKGGFVARLVSWCDAQRRITILSKLNSLPPYSALSGSRPQSIRFTKKSDAIGLIVIDKCVVCTSAVQIDV